MTHTYTLMDFEGMYMQQVNRQTFRFASRTTTAEGEKLCTAILTYDESVRNSHAVQFLLNRAQLGGVYKFMKAVNISGQLPQLTTVSEARAQLICKLAPDMVLKLAPDTWPIALADELIPPIYTTDAETPGE